MFRTFATTSPSWRGIFTVFNIPVFDLKQAWNAVQDKQ